MIINTAPMSDCDRAKNAQRICKLPALTCKQATRKPVSHYFIAAVKFLLSIWIADCGPQRCRHWYRTRAMCARAGWPPLS